MTMREGNGDKFGNSNRGPLLKEEMSLTLGTGNNQTLFKKKTKTTYSVRRLTPVECERLMGWPDNHTELDKDGNVISDSARYKMIGNGIVTPVAQWVCTNIVKALEEEKHEATN